MITEDEIQRLRNLLKLEQHEQEQKWISKGTDYKQLRNEGVLLYPIHITKRRFGFADYPVLEFSFSYVLSNPSFRSGAPVALFDEETREHINGSLISLSEYRGEILLYTHDFPDFTENKNIGIRLTPDTRSFDQMHGVLKRIDKNENPELTKKFEIIHGIQSLSSQPSVEITEWYNQGLNPSQQKTVEAILGESLISIVHGPPGTGKTTTLIEAIRQLVKRDKKIIVAAPSNAAVDHLAEGLLKSDLKIIRLGNTLKARESIWKFTPEGILSQPDLAKQLKKLRIRADEYRRMAGQYKRNFGKEEREQRYLLQKEVKAIRGEIQQLSELFLHRELKEAHVVLGTPIGLRDKLIYDISFDYFFLDEAAQCLEPLAWVGADLAKNLVLAGDPFQLPPTVLSEKAEKDGLSISILEQAFNTNLEKHLLTIQYRMPPEIIGFSSMYFYNNELKSNKETADIEDPLIFIDTAGADFAETKEDDGSIHNERELEIIEKLLPEWKKAVESISFVSPYAGQVARAHKLFPDIRTSTIDAYQGQEDEMIILSLVRSNPNGHIGFLSDYRRMNVALTRAQRKLVIIGDSATLGNDDFYRQFLDYLERVNGYKSVFEFLSL